MNFVIEQTRELIKARSKHGKIHSAHEGYAVILEEVDELWEEVRRKVKNHRPHEMYKELTQIAAMSQRMAEDLELK